MSGIYQKLDYHKMMLLNDVVKKSIMT